MVTPFYGKNLCNLFSNLIIVIFSTIDDNHLTSINVTYTGQFYVLTGKTTIKKPLNYSEHFSEYISDIFGGDKNVNVIDLIEYNKVTSLNNFFIDVKHKNIELLFPHIIKESKNQGYFTINEKNNTIYSNNKFLYEKLIDLFEEENYNFVFNNLNLPYVSDDMFGLNLQSKKIYQIYLNYISYNLFEKQLCKEINYFISYEGDINNLNWETMFFDVECKGNIVSEEWIKSLILDIFDFDINHIKNHLGLGEYNFENEILSNNRCWIKKDKTKDMILL